MNKNNDREEIKLTRKEANIWEFRHSSNPDYHFEKIDNFFGTKYDAKLVKSNSGNVYLKEKERYGGFFYLGSLLVLIFTGVISVLLLINGIINIINGNIGAGIGQIVAMIFPLIFFVNSFNDFVEEVKEKKEYKKNVREGKVKKEKLQLGAIIYRIFLFAFILFFVFMALGFFLSSCFDIDIMQIFYTPNV